MSLRTLIFRISLSLPVFLCLSCTMPSARAQDRLDAATTARLDSLFSDWRAGVRPGGAVAALIGGKVVYKHAFGYADVAKRIPNTTSTSFDLASNAKQFTATGIALLEEAGVLSAQDTIQQQYPGFRVTTPIRIEHLLRHTSGIRESYVVAVLAGYGSLTGKLPERRNNKDFLIGIISQQSDLNFQPGDEMVYTNTNYILLADIIEKVTGQSFTRYCDSAMLKPLGMHRTYIRDTKRTDDISLAKGYKITAERKFKQQKTHGGVVGDHNMVSTIDDIILWEQNAFKNRLGSKGAELFPRLLRDGKLNNGTSVGYSYGMNIGNHGGASIQHHGGDDGAFTSYILRFPALQASFICLSNAGDFENTRLKAFKLADIFLKDKLTAIRPPEIDKTNAIRMDTTTLRARTGVYLNRRSNGLVQLRKISTDDSALYISDHFHVRGLKLEATSPADFVAFNSNGEPLYISFGGRELRENYWDYPQPLVFEKAQETAPGDNTGYKGKYVHAGTGATIRVRLSKKGMFAKKGLIRIPLLRLSDNLYYGTLHDVAFLFTRGADGQVTSVRLNAPDLRNFEMKKS